MDEDEVLARRRLGSVVGGKWTLEKVLGAGGVGAVYQARSASGEEAAIKILHGELAHKSDVKERFLREGTLANKVGHDGALRVLDQGTTDDGAGFLVMELLEGETLTQLLRKDGPIGVKELFGYLDQVLDVLAAAHSQGIIHRDLKPDNLFLTVSGQLKVLDFGLARRLADIKGSFKTKTGLALGTLPYMAPEQALGRRAEVDGRVDLFALGAMAFRVLARRKIHEADSEAELLMKMASSPAPALARYAPNLPQGVHQVVDMALAFSRDARYPDARTMQHDIRDVLAGRPPRHASQQQAERDYQTRMGAAPPVSSGRRIARTEPLDARTRTEPLGGLGGAVQALGPQPSSPVSAAGATSGPGPGPALSGFAAGVTLSPYSQPAVPVWSAAAAATDAAPRAMAPGLSSASATQRSKLPFVLLGLFGLCVLAGGAVLLLRELPNSSEAAAPARRPESLQATPGPGNDREADPAQPAAATKLPASVPADSPLPSPPTANPPPPTETASDLATLDAPGAAHPEAAPGTQAEGSSSAQAGQVPPSPRAADARSKPAAGVRPTAPRLGRPRD